MSSDPDQPIPLSRVYEEAFVRISHELVIMGHRRLDKQKLVDLDETAITGKLCDEMEAALDADSRPDWATHFTTVDDQPESVDEKTGNRRPRTDVCVRCINPRPSSRFRFEAKRLFDSSSLHKYLGDEGMLAIISGHYGDLTIAGMIGYVQHDSPNNWSGRIKKAIGDSPSKFHAMTPVKFEVTAVNAPEPVFASYHRHGTATQRRTITHTLLACA
jgi:hypothetical protein